MVHRVYGDQFKTIVNTSYVHKKYAALLPSNVNSPERDYKVAAAGIFSEIVQSNHKKYALDIQRKFGINIEKYLHGYKIAKNIGVQSAYGTLYFVYAPANFDPAKGAFFARRHVLKIQKNRRGEFGLAYEAHVHKKFAAHGLAPKIMHDHHLRLHDNVELGIMIMDKYSQNTVESMFKRDLSKFDFDMIYEGVIRILNKLCAHGLIHGDLHWGNIGIEFNERAPNKDWPFTLSLLDFGQSTEAKCNMRLELLQLLRTISMMQFKNKNMRVYLEHKLYNYYKSKFKDGLKMQFGGSQGYENYHGVEWNRNIEKIFSPKAAAYLRKFKYERA